MSQLILWPLLKDNSRKALVKERGRFGHKYHYRPRGDLLRRLSRDTGLSIDEVHAQLLRERAVMQKLLGVIPFE